MPTLTGGPVANVTGLFNSFVTGNRLIDGGDLAQLAQMLFSYNPNVVSTGGGTVQASAQLLSVGWNMVSAATTSTANLAVQLPNALPGMTVNVYNQASVAITVYGSAANPNNAGAADIIWPAGTSVSNSASSVSTGQLASRVAAYFCYAAGAWKQLYYASA